MAVVRECKQKYAYIQNIFINFFSKGNKKCLNAFFSLLKYKETNFSFLKISNISTNNQDFYLRVKKNDSSGNLKKMF